MPTVCNLYSLLQLCLLDRTFPLRVFSALACCVIPAGNGKNDRLEGASYTPSPKCSGKKILTAGDFFNFLTPHRLSLSSRIFHSFTLYRLTCG